MTIKQQTLERAIAFLNALGATYAIIDKEGNKYGTLEIKESHKQGSKYPYGTLSNFVKDFIKDMQVGEVVCIPPSQFEIEDVRSAAVSWAIYNWGSGSVTTSINRNLELIEVLRIS